MGAAVAAIIIRKEEDIASQFREQRATSPATAQTLDELRVEHDRIFRRLEERAIIRQGANGTYYLDEPSWNAMRSSRRRIAIVGIVVLLAVLLLGYVVTTSTKRSVTDTQPATQSDN